MFDTATEQGDPMTGNPAPGQGTGYAGDPSGAEEGSQVASLEDELIQRGLPPEEARRLSQQHVPKSVYQQTKEQLTTREQQYAQLAGAYQQIQQSQGTQQEKQDALETLMKDLGDGEEAEKARQFVSKLSTAMREQFEEEIRPLREQVARTDFQSGMSQWKEALAQEYGNEHIEKVWPQLYQKTWQRYSQGQIVTPKSVFKEDFEDTYLEAAAARKSKTKNQQAQQQRNQVMEGGYRAQTMQPPLAGGGNPVEEQPKGGQQRELTTSEVVADIKSRYPDLYNAVAVKTMRQ